MIDYKKLALEEYNSGETTAHHGGKDGRPFWNANATQFTFVPAFQFCKIPKAKTYLFTATDESGKTYSFVDKSPTALLTPIWKDIPSGVVTLKVDGYDENGKFICQVGSRTFYKCAPFLGSNAYAPKKREYKESAKMALEFVYNEPFVKYWRQHKKPDPTYIYNVYPSKTHSSVINALLKYAKLEPKNAQNAIETATILANYLIEISYKDGASKGLPPTYYKNCYVEQNTGVKHTAEKYDGQIMLIYPATVMIAYLNLYEVVKEQKYLDSAIQIATYYQKTINENGTWPLKIYAESGEPVTNNLCMPQEVAKAFKKLYDVTLNESYLDVYNKAFNYIKEVGLKTYNWEAQFEDIVPPSNYENLTHFAADAYIEYIANKSEYSNEDTLVASDLIRFVEDQFVVWGKHSSLTIYDSSNYLYPACLEQYSWYLPIDASSATIMRAFCCAYKITKNPLYIDKARALANMITNVQNDRSGAIPTYWMHEDCSNDLNDFWVNCHIESASALDDFQNFLKTL